MNRYNTTDDLLKLMSGVDGIELMCFEDDKRGHNPQGKGHRASYELFSILG